MFVTALVIAKLTDLGIKNGIVTVTAARKIVNTISSLGSTAVIVIAPYVDSNKTIIMTSFSLCFVFKGLYYPGIKTNILDLSPNYAGILSGITNGIGSTMGILGPILTGYLISNNSGRVWSIVFSVTGIFLSVTSLFYLIFGSGKLQRWNNEKEVNIRRTSSHTDKIELETK
ncbi:putative inorganic phosphate cotransporter [Ctenocephalides felis]|uniref:putative inorganic phosphate cotransporter n=1 Tax=Ctenocephalides felis TaxID=7515 RepID=UPI000E6E36ED|nr:putative inorganic phosphate cotransporter [Ctenocephalides felis]